MEWRTNHHRLVSISLLTLASSTSSWLERIRMETQATCLQLDGLCMSLKQCWCKSLLSTCWLPSCRRPSQMSCQIWTLITADRKLKLCLRSAESSARARKMMSTSTFTSSSTPSRNWPSNTAANSWRTRSTTCPVSSQASKLASRPWTNTCLTWRLKCSSSSRIRKTPTRKSKNEINSKSI